MRISSIFTVFTAAYNRSSTLPRLYHSLLNQTLTDFEWIVVDDGSTDDTEILVREWQRLSPFQISYFKQVNSGKHVAFNRGVREALGTYFVNVDSDDQLLPQALERFLYHWTSIVASDRDRYWGVCGLSIDISGWPLDEGFAVPWFDATLIYDQYRFRGPGDRCCSFNTTILKQYPFPEIPGEKFISEGTVWLRIAKGFSTRFVNEPFQIVEYRQDGLSASSLRSRVGNPHGARLYYGEFCQIRTSLRWRGRGIVNYIRFSLHARIGAAQMLREAALPIVSFFLFPLGYFFYKLDHRKLGS